MARVRYNHLHTQLATGIDASAATINLVDPFTEGGVNIPTITAPDVMAIGFRNPDGTLSDEIAHVTAYTSGALTATIARGQGSTAAESHEAFSEVSNVIAKADIDGFAPVASPTFTGLPTGPQWKSTGVTGANTTPLTLSGANASGAPTTGAHVKGEIAGDDTGKLWYCTVAGTPGTWVDVGTGGGGGSVHVKDYARATRTSGNITINGTSWANVDTGVDLTLTAAAGDVIEVCPSARVAAGAAGTHTFFDVATIVSGSPVNYFSTSGGATDEGVIGWRCHGDRDSSFGNSVARTLVSGDVSAGTVVLRLRTRQDTAGNRLFVAGTTNPFIWYAKNLGAAT